LILNATENYYLLVGFVVCDDAHRVVVDVVEFVRIETELQLDPHFLVQQEQVDIVQQWCNVLLA